MLFDSMLDSQSMVYINLSISILYFPKKNHFAAFFSFFCTPSGNTVNYGNMFIVLKCHTRNPIYIVDGEVYRRVFHNVRTNFPNI